MQIGYMLSCEEHTAGELVANAARAEEIGFDYAVLSDHFHPWISAQGQSPFAWTVLGGIAATTDRIQLGTAVTCPFFRYHPAVVAQAAATTATLAPGRFMLGVGTGENLNEHVVGALWPDYDTRAAMLTEAIEIMRLLWQGGQQSYDGRHLRLVDAELYSRPDEPVPIIVAASAPKGAALAGELGDGLMNYAPDPSVVEAFDAAGGAGKPRYLQVNVCWADDEAAARKTVHRLVPSVGLPGEMGSLLPTPAHYEQVSTLVTEDRLAEVIALGPDPEVHLAAISEATGAGYDHLQICQVGPDQEGFFRFYQDEIFPRLGR